MKFTPLLLKVTMAGWTVSLMLTLLAVPAVSSNVVRSPGKKTSAEPVDELNQLAELALSQVLLAPPVQSRLPTLPLTVSVTAVPPEEAKLNCCAD